MRFAMIAVLRPLALGMHGLVQPLIKLLRLSDQLHTLAEIPHSLIKVLVEHVRSGAYAERLGQLAGVDEHARHRLAAPLHRLIARQECLLVPL